MSLQKVIPPFYLTSCFEMVENMVSSIHLLKSSLAEVTFWCSHGTQNFASFWPIWRDLSIYLFSKLFSSCSKCVPSKSQTIQPNHWPQFLDFLSYCWVWRILYSRHKFLCQIFVVCKYFLPEWVLMVWLVLMVKFTNFSFVHHAFGVMYRNFSPGLGSWRFSLMYFTLKCMICLCLKFRSSVFFPQT